MSLDPFEPLDAHDPRLNQARVFDALSSLNGARILQASDVHVARRICAAGGETQPSVLIGVGLAVRALRGGSVCVDLADVAGRPLGRVEGETLSSSSEGSGLDAEPVLLTPTLQTWLAELRASPLHNVAVRLEGSLLYLDRYWREEALVAEVLTARLDAEPPRLDLGLVQASAAELFPEGWDEQRAAAVAAVKGWTTVITGGPGTGKTTSVAGLLAVLKGQAPEGLRIALAAPTGKAAARLQESVADSAKSLPGVSSELSEVPALTLHRLLGSRPDSKGRFKHDRRNRLGYDVIVVDEFSMVPLTMMARLLEAIRPDTRLVLVGDPDQLTSVEAGAVLADLVAGLGSKSPDSVVRLRTAHRYGATIGAFAQAVRGGDAAAARELLVAGHEDVEFIDASDATALGWVYADLARRSEALQKLADSGDVSASLAVLEQHRTLCAHREGPFGVATLNFRAERAIAEAIGVGVGASWGREWYAGRPILVSTNDYSVGLFNGDVGVTVRDGDALRVVLPDGRSFGTARLGGVETMHALTVHKSQGGQADEITVVLPEEGSPLLTRELLYTAVTRAKRRVRVVGSLAAVERAVHTPAGRASGLRERLAGA